MNLRGIQLTGKWSREEVEMLEKLLRPIPDAWLEGNKFATRIDRQSVLQNAPSSAPGHSKYEPSDGSIVVFDKGVYHGDRIDPEQFRRSVYHELAHSISRMYPGLLASWVRETKGDGFVDDYAKTSPAEDFCDTFSEFFIAPDKTRQRVPRKSSFMADMLGTASQQEEKVAMSFMHSFADELTKTANAGAMRSILGKITGSSLGRKGLLATGAVTAGGAFGHSKGKKSGFESGSANMDKGMRQAYQVGVRRGAQAMYQQIATQMQGQGR